MAYIGKTPSNAGQLTSEEEYTATDVFGGGVGRRVFTLVTAVGRETDIIVSINGVGQPASAYTLSGTDNKTLTFPAPAAVAVGDVLRVQHIGYKPTTFIPAVNSVDGSHLKIGTPVVGDVIYYNGTDYIRLAKGTAAQVLTMNGGATAPSWADAAEGGGPALGAGGANTIIRTNLKTISENLTFVGNENGMTAGPITVADGYTVTVTSGSVWTIV